MIVRALRWLDRRIYSAVIPVAHFGWRQTGTQTDAFGIVWPVGRWEWPEAHRGPFYRHNQRLMREAVMFRRLAVKFSKRGK